MVFSFMRKCFGSERVKALNLSEWSSIADQYRLSRSNVRQFVDNLSNCQNVFHKNIHIIHFFVIDRTGQSL